MDFHPKVGGSFRAGFPNTYFMEMLPNNFKPFRQCILLLLPILSTLYSPAFYQELPALENALLYFPDKKIGATPDKIKLKFDEITLETADQVKINAWWLPNDKAKATLLFSHGNAGNISNRLEKLKIFHDLGLNVLIYDYRGYGKSEGKPNEKGLYADAQAANDYAVKEKKIPADQIISYGESLGGAVAAHLAAGNKAKALILDSTFSSLEEMAKERMPLLAGLAKGKFDTLASLKKTECPVLVLHSPDDEVVPYKQGRSLFDTAKEPKSFVKLSGGHNDGFWKSKNVYIKRPGRFFPCTSHRRIKRKTHLSTLCIVFRGGIHSTTSVRG